MSTDSQRDSIRASNADREGVLEILHGALAEGRITGDEYRERSAAALDAQTVGELRPLVADLPVGFRDTPPPPASASAGGETVEWRGSFSSLERSGVWQVPRRILLQRKMGSVELDFTEAQFTSDTVDIDLDVVGGSVELRLPDGASASIHEVAVVLGSVEDHRKNTNGSGRPHLRLTGTVKMGSVEIRGPKKKLFT